MQVHERRAFQRSHFLLIQKWVCGICDQKVWSDSCHLDHSHVTGLCRGVLCPPCNIRLRDADVEKCRAKIRYFLGLDDNTGWIQGLVSWWGHALVYLHTVESRTQRRCMVGLVY